MTGTVDKKAALLARRAKSRKQDVVLDDITVTVRALERGEVVDIREQADGDEARQECLMIATALVDPELTVDEVAEWLADAPMGDAVSVMDTVAKLSGIKVDATKSRMARDGKRRRG